MAYILNIDTALDRAYITLAEDGRPVLSAFNESQRDHAAWIQVAIQKLTEEAGLVLQEMNAVGISIGPGSYTGLRIGLSTAKGICYALNIPLITVNSLKIWAFSAINYVEKSGSYRPDSKLLFCPMIDARRMEVFTALYDPDLKEVIEPQACILNKNSFERELERQKILFLGNGSSKFQSVCENPSALFEKIPLNPEALGVLTYKNFIGNNFADLTYTEPLYLKEFFTK
jgi:tRNA threonylcarbamoyladenosine biosynthesis protein TsaB